MNSILHPNDTEDAVSDTSEAAEADADRPSVSWDTPYSGMSTLPERGLAHYVAAHTPHCNAQLCMRRTRLRLVYDRCLRARGHAGLGGIVEGWRRRWAAAAADLRGQPGHTGIPAQASGSVVGVAGAAVLGRVAQRQHECDPATEACASQAAQPCIKRGAMHVQVPQGIWPRPCWKAAALDWMQVRCKGCSAG